MNTKHTPGPWRWAEGRINSAHGLVMDASAYEGMWFSRYRIEEDNANARLMASAPELLAELLLCKEFLEDMHTQNVDWTVIESQIRHKAVSDLIAKATGESA